MELSAEIEVWCQASQKWRTNFQHPLETDQLSLHFRKLFENAHGVISKASFMPCVQALRETRFSEPFTNGPSHVAHL